MARNTSVSLSDHFDRFIEREIRNGHYGSASEVVRDGLRLLEERRAKIEALRQALILGEGSGPTTPLDMAAVKGKARAQAASGP